MCKCDVSECDVCKYVTCECVQRVVESRDEMQEMRVSVFIHDEWSDEREFYVHARTLGSYCKNGPSV